MSIESLHEGELVENESWIYTGNRSVSRGDKLRISKGPYYLTQDGKRISMAEKGIHTFIKHVQVRNAKGGFKSEYLVVAGVWGASIVIPLGQKRSKYGMPYKCRPYKFSKVRE